MSEHQELTLQGVPRRRGGSRIGLRRRRVWLPTIQKMREHIQAVGPGLLFNSFMRRPKRNMDHSGIAIVFGDLPRDMLFASVRDAKSFVAGEVTLKEVVDRFESREDLAEVYRAVALCPKCVPCGVDWIGDIPYYATLTTHPSKHLVEGVETSKLNTPNPAPNLPTPRK